ncbi:MCE family protein [Williamsia herbipolensis]|uniref:MCE family protein n=1 Tax=Williamsia herbipolensis TaxID=1603258 RepID=UPI0005F7CC30|nr:MCE family protein [Williamsia herbipolensis]
MTARRTWAILAAIVALAAVVSYAVVPRLTTYSVRVELASATGLYVGDDVRVVGVRIGEVSEVHPRVDHAEVVLRLDRARPVPAEATAVVLNQSLVSGRFVQFTPAWTSGARMTDGAVVPIARTAVPVEWNEVTAQLERVSKALAPRNGETRGAVGALVDSAAANLRGQGGALNSTLGSLSAALRTISDGRTDLFGVVRNLAVFVEALSDSDQQIVSFNRRMASVTAVLDRNRDDIGSALGDLDVSLGEVRSFVKDNRPGLSDALKNLNLVAGELASHRDDLAQVLHVTPTALANLNNIYQPAHNSITSALALSNFANPVQFVCSAIAAAQQSSAERGASLCVRYLGPLLSLLTADYPPIAFNPTRGVGALPDQLVYSEPSLRPGTPSARKGATPSTPDLPSMLVPQGGR